MPSKMSPLRPRAPRTEAVIVRVRVEDGGGNAGRGTSAGCTAELGATPAASRQY
jgi:hypothetical protein